MMRPTTLTLFTVLVGAVIAESNCFAQPSDSTNHVTVEHVVPKEKLLRLDLITWKTDYSAFAPVSIVVAGNTENDEARAKVVLSTIERDLGGATTTLQLVSLRLQEGFAYVSIGSPITLAPQAQVEPATLELRRVRNTEDQAAADEEGKVITWEAVDGQPIPDGMLHIEQLNRDQEGEIASATMTVFFPVIWLNDVEAGAPGTKFVIQATGPNDRDINRSDEHIRFLLIEGTSGITARVRNGPPRTLLQNADQYYMVFERKWIQNLGRFGETFVGSRPRGNRVKIGDLIKRANDVATAAGLP